MPSDMVSGVGQGTSVLNGGPHPLKGTEVLVFFHPTGLNDILSVFLYLTHA